MADTPTPTRGVPIQLDRLRHIRFSLKTTKEMRAKFGDDTLKDGFDQDKIAELLWFGLKWEDADLTVDQVEDMVDLENLTEVMKAVSKATGTLALMQEAGESKGESSKEETSPPLPPAPDITPPEKPEDPPEGSEDAKAEGSGKRSKKQKSRTRAS